MKIDNLVLEWVRDRNRVEAVARGLTALDAKEQVVFRAERAEISLDAGALLSRQVQDATAAPRERHGLGGALEGQGVWSLADIVIAREPASDKPFDPLKDLNWETLATPIRALISAGSFERVELVQLQSHGRRPEGRHGVERQSGARRVERRRADGVALDLDVKLGGPGRAQPRRDLARVRRRRQPRDGTADARRRRSDLGRGGVRLHRR